MYVYLTRWSEGRVLGLVGVLVVNRARDQVARHKRTHGQKLYARIVRVRVRGWLVSFLRSPSCFRSSSSFGKAAAQVHPAKRLGARRAAPTAGSPLQTRTAIAIRHARLLPTRETRTTYDMVLHRHIKPVIELGILLRTCARLHTRVRVLRVHAHMHVHMRSHALVHAHACMRLHAHAHKVTGCSSGTPVPTSSTTPSPTSSTTPSPVPAGICHASP